MSLLLVALLVSAAPSAGARDCEVGEAEAMAALNEARAAARHCGAQAFTAAAPLHWNAALAASAQRFAEELAQRDSISHEGQALPTLGARLHAVDYPLRMGAENLAAGQRDLDELLAQWLASPTHCANLMQPLYEDAGLACVRGPGRYGWFWVLHLGTPARLRSSPGR